MRRRLVSLPALAAVAVLSAACTGGFSPDWTLGPSPSSAAPAPSGSAGASGSAAPSAVPSGSGGPSASASIPASVPPSPATSPSAGGSTVDITASGIAFTTPTVTAPAGAPFTIHFDNQDANTPHNVQVKDASGQSVFKGEIFNGVAAKDYQVNALQAGTYSFVCDVHPNMTGTLTAS
jgi:plastocyanin